MFQTQTFLASHTNTKSSTTTETAGRMQAEKHRSALPKAPIQTSGARPGHGIAQHHPRLGGDCQLDPWINGVPLLVKEVNAVHILLRVR